MPHPPCTLPPQGPREGPRWPRALGLLRPPVCAWPVRHCMFARCLLCLRDPGLHRLSSTWPVPVATDGMPLPATPLPRDVAAAAASDVGGVAAPPLAAAHPLASCNLPAVAPGAGIFRSMPVTAAISFLMACTTTVSCSSAPPELSRALVEQGLLVHCWPSGWMTTSGLMAHIRPPHPGSSWECPPTQR